MENNKEQISDIKETKELTFKEKINLKMFAYGFVGIVVVAVIVLGGTGVYKVYAKGASDTFTVTVAKILRLPAAKLDDQIILYKDYITDTIALKQYRSYVSKSAATSGQTVNITDEQITQDAMFRLIDNILVKKLAAQNGISYAQTDVDKIKANILTQFTTTADAEAEIKSMFGWDFATYSKRIIEPGALKNNVNAKIKEIAKKEGEKVLAEIKNGSDFSKLAKTHGADGTRDTGGDLGWFESGDMLKEFETAVAKLSKGELSSVLVETTYGYHIVKLVDTRISTSTDSAGKKVTAQEWKASHILFPLDINYYLDKSVRASKFKLYIPIENPLKNILSPSTGTTNTKTTTTTTTTNTSTTTSST